MTELYQNKRNPNKFIEVVHYKDGHYVWAQFITGYNPVLDKPVTNYTGTRHGKRRLSRVHKATMKEVLHEEYKAVCV